MTGEGLGQARTRRDGTRKRKEEREQGEHAQADEKEEYSAVTNPKLKTAAYLSHISVNRSSSKERWTVYEFREVERYAKTK